MKRCKKVLALVLTVIMLLTSIPLCVSASSGISVGNTITLGSYNGEPISWICVDIDDNGPLMLSEKVLCTKEYDAAGTSSTYHTDSWGYVRKDRGSNCWEDSNIRQWLNSSGTVNYSHCPPSYKSEVGFMSNFTNDELSCVKKVAHKVTMVKYDSTRKGYCDGGSTDIFSYGASFNINNCYHKLLEDYFMLLDASQINSLKNRNSPYLNCGSSYFTAAISGNNNACFELVNPIGGGTNWAYKNNGIRPAFYLDESLWNRNNRVKYYNLGEETYSFRNYPDQISTSGHCFGMSITSAGYHLGYLNSTDLGINDSSEIFSIVDNPIVRIPICYYQNLQGSLRDQAIVAGNTSSNIFNKYNVESDWNEIIDYVKEHSYDDKGLLQIVYFFDGGGHAINFLRYDDENEQLCVYDNNTPNTECTLKINADGSVTTPFGYATSIALIYVPSYFNAISSKEVVDNIIRNSIYFYRGDVSIVTDGKAYTMAADNSNSEYCVFEVAEMQSTVKIVPLIDNASFRYMEKEYTFNEIRDDTYAELKLSTSEDEVPVFTVYNEPEDNLTVPEIEDTNNSFETNYDNCNHICHKSGFMGFIWKILRFFCKLFGSQPICSCGVAHY